VPLVRFDSLRTDRLVMRRWRDGDREPFAALNADPHTMRFFPSTLDRTASDAMVDRLEERFETQGFGLWALEIARWDNPRACEGSPLRPSVAYRLIRASRAHPRAHGPTTDGSAAPAR
jgi:RimJ/RimL family protein N-acetyltransferase